MSLVRRVPGFPLLTVLHYPDIQQLSVQSCPRWATGKKSLFLKDKLEYYPFNDLGESVTISTVSTTALHNVKGEKHTRFHSRLCWWKINPHPESLHTRSTPSLRYHKGVWDSCRKKLCHEHKKLVFWNSSLMFQFIWILSTHSSNTYRMFTYATNTTV